MNNNAPTKGQHGAYNTHQRGEETVRETEARALLSCASRLEKARQTDSSMDDYIDAIKHNQQLWTIFQVCLCEPDNQLPRELKILLLNLSRFVDHVSFRALSEYLPATLTSLIDINRNIAAGLNTKQPGETKHESTSTQAPSTAPATPGSLATTA